MARQVFLRRVYDDPSSDGGLRVLVDRVWPRGLTKDAAHLDEWIKDVAPSTPLRRWYGHRPERFTARLVATGQRRPPLTCRPRWQRRSAGAGPGSHTDDPWFDVFFAWGLMLAGRVNAAAAARSRRGRV